MADLICPCCKKDLAGYAGEVSVVPDFDEAVRTFNYENIDAELEEGMRYFPEEFFKENPPDVISYFPKISADITCPFCREQFPLELRDDDVEELKNEDRGIGGSEVQEIFGDHGLQDRPGTYHFEELHLESGKGEYHGKKVFRFNDIMSVHDLKQAVEKAAQEGYAWFESPEKPEFSGIIYGSLKESLIDKEEIEAYVKDAYYLARNKRPRECFELLRTAKENIRHISRKDVDDAMKPESLGSFVKKYIPSDKAGLGRKILGLFR